MATLKPGDIAPDFNLSDQNGNTVSLSDFKGSKVLLYFYPKANTPGCTTQSQNVRDAKPEFEDIGVSVLGISPDPPDKQKKFDEKYNLGFPLLADTDNTVSTAYGVWGEKTVCGKQCMGIKRSSFLIDEDGKIMQAWYKVTPKDMVPKEKKFLT